MLAAAVVAASAAVAGCSGAPGTADAAADGIDVIVSSYPLEFVVTEVAGDRVDVENLTARGASSHGVELTPVQIAAIGDADLVVHLTGMSPGIDDAVQAHAPAHLVDAAELADRGSDPHVWLDPTHMVTLANQVADTLTELDPDAADTYGDGADQLVARLEELDADYRAALAECAGETLVTSHEAFGYLAARYGLEQVGISGVDPEVEPSPARLGDVIDVIEGRRVTTVFFEATTSPAVAQVFADDLGLSTGVLHPIERVEADEDYDGLMRANLAALRGGLTCAG